MSVRMRDVEVRENFNDIVMLFRKLVRAVIVLMKP